MNRWHCCLELFWKFISFFSMWTTSITTQRWTQVLEDLPAMGRTGISLGRQSLQQNARAILGHLFSTKLMMLPLHNTKADWVDKEFLQNYPQATVKKVVWSCHQGRAHPNLESYTEKTLRQEACHCCEPPPVERLGHDANSFIVTCMVNAELLKCILFMFKSGALDVDDTTCSGFFAIPVYYQITWGNKSQAYNHAVVSCLVHGGHISLSLDHQLHKRPEQWYPQNTWFTRDTVLCLSFYLDIYHHWVEPCSTFLMFVVKALQALKMKVKEHFLVNICCYPCFNATHCGVLTMVACFFNDAVV